MLMIKALTCGFALIAGLAGVPGGTEPALFGPTGDEASAFGAPEPWELRKRLASVNREVLSPWCDPPDSGLPDSLTMNLFDETVIIGVAEKVGRSGRATLNWRGSVQDVPDSSVTLSAIGLCDADAAFSLAGSVRINGEEYTFEPRSGGRVVITEIDTTTSGLLQKPGEPPPEEERAAAEPAGTRQAPKPGQSVIDVLMLYTPGAAAQAGGREEIEAWIEDAAARANNNFADSGVNVAFRVIASEAVDYTGEETVQPAFNALIKKKDGQIDDATERRDKHGADIVTLVVKGYNPKTGIAGLASYPENPSNPKTSKQIWATVAANQLWAYILPHEWGHLLGLDHDWVTSAETNTFYPDNHGYVASDQSFVTIMGYPSACSPRPCPYAGYFANPAIKHDGETLGIPLGQGEHPADNTRVMNITGPQVAAYREPASALPDKKLRLQASAGGTAAAATSGPYALGDVTTVEAVASPGHVFDGWLLDGKRAGAANPFSVEMQRDHTLAALFVPGTAKTHRLESSADPATGGAVKLSPAGPEYAEGTMVTATARNKTGQQFSGWILDGKEAGDDEEITIEMSRPHTLVARYSAGAKDHLSVGTRPSDGGDVELSEPSADGDVSVLAEPARGFTFDHWEVNGEAVGTEPALSLVLSGEDRLEAVFTQDMAAPAESQPSAAPAAAPAKPAQAKPPVALAPVKPAPVPVAPAVAAPAAAPPAVAAPAAAQPPCEKSVKKATPKARAKAKGKPKQKAKKKGKGKKKTARGRS